MNYPSHSFDKQFLFSPKRLEDLSKWKEIISQLKQRNLQARPLRLDDYDTGYLQLLSQLTGVGDISRDSFEKRFLEMKSINHVSDHYAVVVIVDEVTNRIVGASTFFLEYKFIHECATRGRLEDVVVLDSHRGKQIGELVVQIIVELARESFRCYKLSLDCKDELKGFYKKNNFSQASNMLAIRFQ